MATTAEFADVTVIVPARRAAATIDRALASVAAQTLRPAAVVVVDDGSDDGTDDAALRWKERLKGAVLTVFRQPHTGAGAARNRALKEAKTEFVAFLDADDEWLPAKLERSMAAIRDTEYVLVAHDSWQVEDGDEVRIGSARRFRAGKASPFVALYRRGFIDTSTVVARRDAVCSEGGFDTTLANAQDFELWLALLRRPETKFHVFEEPLSRYHVTSGSIMSHIDRRRRCCMEIARRYVFDLRNHPGSPLLSLWFRTLATHLEAVAAFRTRGEVAMAARTLLVLPANILGATFSYLTGRRPRRHPGLQ